MWGSPNSLSRAAESQILIGILVLAPPPGSRAMGQVLVYLSKEKRENPPSSSQSNGAVWVLSRLIPAEFPHILEVILTPEMSATLWIGTSFLLCSPFPFLMALEKRGSAGNELLTQP